MNTSFFKEYRKMATSQHDPLPRQQLGEPHFILLGRDWSSSEIVRIWVAIRRRDESMLDAIVKRVKQKMRERPYHPRDSEHVVSAQQVANSLDLWLVERSAKPMMGEI